MQGISPLHIAVRIRSDSMVSLLLKQPHIDIGDTVLHAIRDNNIGILGKSVLVSISLSIFLRN